MSGDEKPSLQTTQYASPPAYLEPPLAHHVPPPTHHMSTTTVTITTPTISNQPGYSTTATVTVTPSMGTKPAQHICPSCRHVIVTRVEKNTTTKTHIVAVLLFAAFLWPCALIPYCTNTCKSIEHYCPNCNAYIGAYKN